MQVSLQIHSQVVKVKNSCVVKGESDLYFSHRMTFKLRSQHLEEACLRLELQQPGDSRSGGRASEQLIQSWSPTDVPLSTAFLLLFCFIARPPNHTGSSGVGPLHVRPGPPAAALDGHGQHAAGATHTVAQTQQGYIEINIHTYIYELQPDGFSFFKMIKESFSHMPSNEIIYIHMFLSVLSAKT